MQVVEHKLELLDLAMLLLTAQDLFSLFCEYFVVFLNLDRELIVIIDEGLFELLHLFLQAYVLLE